jgi:hypothetical protein
MTKQNPAVYGQVSKEYSICTVPRVGSFYLQDRIIQHTGVYIKKYHSLKNNKMITIVRDPIDTITSKLAMTAFYDKKNETMTQIRNKKQNTKDLDIYLESLDRADAEDFYIVIDYNDLVTRPFETTTTLADIMNLPIINKDYKENNIREYKENSHIISSKKVDEYEEIKSYVESLDLSRLHDSYNEALARCIKII